MAEPFLVSDQDFVAHRRTVRNDRALREAEERAALNHDGKWWLGMFVASFIAWLVLFGCGYLIWSKVHG